MSSKLPPKPPLPPPRRTSSPFGLGRPSGAIGASPKTASPAPGRSPAKGGGSTTGKAGGYGQPVLPLFAVKLSPQRKRELVGAVLLVAGILTLIRLITKQSAPLPDMWVSMLGWLFGWWAPVTPLALAALGVWLILDSVDGKIDVRWSQPVGGMVAGVAALGLTHFGAVRWGTDTARILADTSRGGGWVGYLFSRPFELMLGPAPAAAALIALGIGGLVYLGGLTLREAGSLVSGLARDAWRDARDRRQLPAAHSTDALAPSWSDRPTLPTAAPARDAKPNPPPSPVATRVAPAKASAARNATAGIQVGVEEAAAGGTIGVPPDRPPWELPAVEAVLEPSVEIIRSPEEARAMAKKIEDTLGEFGIAAKVVEISPGPTITQFGLDPGYMDKGDQRSRVRVSRIVALQNDLSLALAASPLRILAPVPGRPFVGIEVPNAATTIVGLSGVVVSESFRKIATRGGLPIALGRDTSGRPVAADLAAMPHLLIAGATGSGKSVAINTLISSLILVHTPDTMKMLLVDPKRVELAAYRGLPHLAAPVVVEVERVVGVLQWTVREMDRRYRTFSELGVRNIAGYNARMAEKGEPPLPFLVLIIDELADLMMMAPEEAERLITRLAQLARATGIHLVLATQRPSVDVVTGLIKANFPSRIAFAVSSSIDSRVILDTVGADKLLGRGDMLYLASDSSKLQRLQGCFVSDGEIEHLVRFWRRQIRPTAGVAAPAVGSLAAAGGAATSAGGATTASRTPAAGSSSVRGGARSGPGGPMLDDLALTLGVPEPLIQPELWDQMVDQHTGALSDERDDLFDEAVDLIRRHRTASTSFLQRKLRIGYARAGRLMDYLETEGLVGPAQGSTGREVLIGPDEEARPDFKGALDQAFAKNAPRAGAAPDDDFGEPPWDEEWDERDKAGNLVKKDAGRRVRDAKDPSVEPADATLRNPDDQADEDGGEDDDDLAIRPWLKG